jgi:hypothetical protein
MTITLTREEAQQILDALEKHVLEYETIQLLSAKLNPPQPEKCIVKDCENHRHQGHFVGDLCSPCHAFITRNEGKYSQAYRNVQRKEWQGLTDDEIKDMWSEWKDALCLDHKTWAQAIEAKLKEKNG